MLWRNDQRVLDAATELVGRLGDDERHSVAAAAIDVSGRIHTGVNVFHFTGGPCAELVALGQAAAVSTDRIMTIVAVGDRGRGVIAPCGRCRQVLLDLHPDALVLVPAGGTGAPSAPAAEPRAVPVRSLLVDAYASVDNGGLAAPRVLRFAGRYREDVLAGRKSVTIRFRDPYAPGAATFVFEDEHLEGFRTAEGRIEAVERRRFADLTPEDARAENCPDVPTLWEGLRGHYPDITDDDVVDVLRIAVTATA
jgi:cytidine deaminase